MSSGQRAVLLGGTFDPIHNGHLAVAAQARAQLGAAQAWLIPARTPPHRAPALAGAADRLAMVEAAAAGDPELRVLDLELRREGPSYTVDTLVELAGRFARVEQWFVLGADAARELSTWHRVSEVLRVARFVLVNREGVGELRDDEAAAIGFDPARLRVIRVSSPPISATAVRRTIAAGGSLEGVVPEGVARLIAQRGLYGAVAGARLW